MPNTVEIKSGQVNTVTVSPSSVPVVEVSLNAPEEVISVSSSIEIKTTTTVVESFTDTLDDTISVTNEDSAIGEALGRTYLSGTSIESILRDILSPERVPELTADLKIRDHITATQFISAGKRFDFDWGKLVSPFQFFVSIDDEDDLFIESENLLISNNHFSHLSVETLSFGLEDLDLTSWNDLSTDTAISTAVVGSTLNPSSFQEKVFDYAARNDQLFASFEFTPSLRYNRNGVIKNLQAETILVQFLKRAFVSCRDGDGPYVGDPVPLVTYSDTIEDAVYTAELWEETGEYPPVTVSEFDQPWTTEKIVKDVGEIDLIVPELATLVGQSRHITILVPQPLEINLADPNAIKQGNQGISRVFEFMGFTLKDPNEFLATYPNIVAGPNYALRAYRTRQVGSFTGNQVLTVKLSSTTTPGPDFV